MDKTTRKFTWFDLVVVIGVVLLISGICLRFTGKAQTKLAKTPFEVTIVAINVSPELADTAKNAVGTKMSLDEKASSDNIGEILSVKIENDKDVIKMANGTLVRSDIPDKKRVTIVLKCEDGSVDNRGFWTSSLFDVSVGSTVRVKGIGFAFEALIVSVK